MSQDLTFYTESALLDRLSKGLKKRNREVIFLVGAPLSAPLNPDGQGVPGVDSIVNAVRAEFADDHDALLMLDQEIAGTPEKKYQIAFSFLHGRRGQRAANEIVRKSVIGARNPQSALIGADFDILSSTDDDCRLLEEDIPGWVLTPGTQALGSLIANRPELFGKSILTTNFDPLIEVSIRKAGGLFYKTSLHADGYLGQTQASGCHVVHLHGYWYGSDTLHTARQLAQSRPRLRASLMSILKNKTLVVLAYGGWDDAFTDAIMNLLRDDTAYPEIIWTFHAQEPKLSSSLIERLAPGIDRGVVDLYADVDCHRFLPALNEAWLNLETKAKVPEFFQSNPVRVDPKLLLLVETPISDKTVLEGDDEDRPPVVDICVGRERQLEQIRNSKASVVFLTGLGGQGKSTVAAQYFDEAQRDRNFSFYVWRDCKEERERFENQLASVVEKLSEGRISGESLAQQSAASIIQMLMAFIRNRSVLFVFDNVDHHVSLDARRMVGSTDIFIESLLASNSSSRAVFTCRPTVSYYHQHFLGCELKGLDLEATTRLFEERGALSEPSEIEDAHKLTQGHAFWLDLLAIQVVKRAPAIDLKFLLGEIRSGAGIIPETTLQSIWGTLRDRERLVLRAMAETVKPETETEICEYLDHDLHYSKARKALKVLKDLNLIVTKRRSKNLDLLELHPLVRQFVKRNFSPVERSTFIDAIIKRYKQFISNHKFQLSERPSFSTLQYWTQNAELDIAAGNFDDAFFILDEASSAFSSSAFSREFSRVAHLLFSAVNWVKDFARFKNFETVFRAHIRNLSYLGEHSEADTLLEKYELTVLDKDARYIGYCELRCFSRWVRGDFNSAVTWGKIGQDLKTSSGVDTHWDVSHTLALAERDAGRPEVALPTFLGGRSIGEVIDPEELDEKRSGAHYGNIGRCLHFMGQIEGALVCYQKSALLIERDPRNEHTLNQGYIRLWVGELLLARGQLRLAEVFFRAAHLKWQQVFPAKAAKAQQVARQLRNRIESAPVVPDSNLEKICLDWIVGRSIDRDFR